MIDEGITINVLNLGILSNDSVNTLLRNVLLSFAQFERDMIVQRTQEARRSRAPLTRISVRAARPNSTPSSLTMQWLCLKTIPTRRSSS